MSPTTRTLRVAAPVAVLLAALLAVLAAPVPAVATTAVTFDADGEAEFLRLANDERTDRGLRPLSMATGPRLVARDWSRTMAADRRVYHRPNLTAPFTGRWSRLGENVGRGLTVKGLHRAFMNSQAHRDNVLQRDFTWVGIGVVVDGDGTTNVTFNFGAGSDRVASRYHDDRSLRSDAAFADVPGWHTFSSDITWLAADGITKGCNPPANSRYCPDARVTRAQMAAFLVRTLNLTATSPRGRFADVAAGSTFAADINKLATAGITRGCGPNRFCPEDPVTRGQMAAFLTRALKLSSTSAGGRFADVPSRSRFAVDINKLATAGITKGCNPPRNSRYCPDNRVTRAQMAAFLHRAPR